MSLKPDKTYEGEVSSGSWIRSSGNTPGFQVNIKYDGGDTSFTIWLTDKSKNIAKKHFKVLGLSEEQMKSPSYLNNTLPTAIIGRAISFETREETYNEKTRVRVAFINAPKDYNESDVACEAASFFNDGNAGGEDDQPPLPDDGEFQDTDSDIPF